MKYFFDRECRSPLNDCYVYVLYIKPNATNKIILSESFLIFGDKLCTIILPLFIIILFLFYFILVNFKIFKKKF